MYKKLIALTSAGLLIAGLSGCGKSIPETQPPTTAATTAPTETTVPTTAPYVFEETILVDDENCTFTVTAIENESTLGYTLKVYLENKTDRDLTFSLSNVSVNGYMCDPIWASTVTAGMKSNENIRFAQEIFDRNGIETVTDIELQLDVYDSNNWDADHLVSDVFTLYPLGEEAYTLYTRELQDGDRILFDNENCTMIVTGFDPDGIWGYTMNVYLVNKTDKTLMFSVQDAAVNGYMCDPFWAHSIAPGKASNTPITWFPSTLEEAGVTEVETITLPIRVYDSNDWTTPDLLSESFTITP